MLLIAGFIFGAVTMGFVFGYGYCGSCWLGLIRGRRYEASCNDCIMATYRQHTTLSDKVENEGGK
jgi:hypothetical protein